MGREGGRRDGYGRPPGARCAAVVGGPLVIAAANPIPFVGGRWYLITVL